MNPISGFFNYVKDDGFMLTFAYDFVNFLSNVVDVIPSDPCDGLYFEFEGSEWIFLREFKHEIDLVLHGIALVGFAKYIEPVGGSFLDNLELFKIDVFESSQLILLLP